MGRIDVAAESAIARLAAQGDGLVVRSALLSAGVNPSAIDRRVRSGRLRVVHSGVYLTGHGGLRREQHLLAAVLAGGTEALAALGSAAELWVMLSAAPGPPTVLHTGPRRNGPRGIRLHRTTQLPPAERTVHRGIPVTTPLRTLLDLAASGHRGLELALDEALARRLVTRDGLEGLAASGRPGARALGRLLVESPGYTRQEAERRLRSLIREARLPAPRYNARLHGHERDALWARERLVLEVDGFAAHGHRGAFEADRRRDGELLAAGYATLRITWNQLTGEPTGVVARIAGALARR